MTTTVNTADWTIEILQVLKELDYVKDIRIVRPPSNVEVDISLLLEVVNWDQDYSTEIVKLISGFKWGVFDQTEFLPAIHWDYQEAA